MARHHRQARLPLRRIVPPPSPLDRLLSDVATAAPDDVDAALAAARTAGATRAQLRSAWNARTCTARYRISV